METPWFCAVGLWLSWVWATRHVRNWSLEEINFLRLSFDMLLMGAYHQLGSFKKGIFDGVKWHMSQPSLRSRSVTTEAFTDRTEYPSVVMLDTWWSDGVTPKGILRNFHWNSFRRCFSEPELTAMICISYLGFHSPWQFLCDDINEGHDEVSYHNPTRHHAERQSAFLGWTSLLSARSNKNCPTDLCLVTGSVYRIQFHDTWSRFW